MDFYQQIQHLPGVEVYERSVGFNRLCVEVVYNNRLIERYISEGQEEPNGTWYMAHTPIYDREAMDMLREWVNLVIALEAEADALSDAGCVS